MACLSLTEVWMNEMTYSRQLLFELNELRLRQLLCDVVLIAGHRKMPAHKVVLSGCSPYFKAMFAGNLAEKEKTEIELESIDTIALSNVVEYAYSGKVHISQHNVQSLLPAANLLQLTPLLLECCEFLQSQLHPTNSLGIWKFAETHSCNDLCEKALSYTLRHFQTVWKSEEFVELSLSQLCTVLSDDRLVVDSEEAVLHAVNTWIESKPSVRRQCFKDILTSIRLCHVPLTILNEFLESNQHLIDHPISRATVEKTLACKLSVSSRLQASKEDCLCCKSRCSSKTMFAVGGRSGLFASLNSVEVFSCSRRAWDEVTPLSSFRTECAVASIHDQVYVLGGITFENRENGSYRFYDNKVECLDRDGNNWLVKSPMLHQRSAFAVVTFKECLYALGGYQGHQYHSSVERFCPRSDEWSLMPSMLHSRSCFSACCLEGCIYAIGGYGPPCLNSVEKYDPRKKKWEYVTGMGEKRINYGAGVACGCIFVVGGHSGNSPLSGVERYDPVTDQWTFVTGIGRPRTGLSVCTLDNVLYAAGGHSGVSYLKTVQTYNPHEDLWREEEPMKTCRCSFGLVAL